MGNDRSSARSGSALRTTNPSPVPLGLVKTPAAGHPLPEGEGYRSTSPPGDQPEA